MEKSKSACKSPDAILQHYRPGKPLMFITPKRIAYAGLLGNPKLRIFGATTIYTSLGSPFRIWRPGTEVQESRFSIVPAYAPHRVSTPDRNIAEILLEAESADPSVVIERLAGTPSLAKRTAEQVLHGIQYLRENWSNAGDVNFDSLFFKEMMPPRNLDPRIAMIAERISQCPAGKHSAVWCAEQAELSFSRFTHLFGEQLGTTIRRYRAWKRARSVMNFVHDNDNLLETALNIGYADSTHFSHSMRLFYGLPPREIFAGGKAVAVFEQHLGLTKMGDRIAA